MATLERISELFQDADLRARLTDARSEDEALGLLVAAGAARNLPFSAESLRRLIEIFASPERKALTDEELKEVAGRMVAAGTHDHMSCCTECPKSAALCCKGF